MPFYTLCCYRRPAIFYKLLNNKVSMFSQSRHGIHWTRHVHRCSTTCSTPLYALPIRSYAPPKSGCSFCRILYNIVKKPTWCTIFLSMFVSFLYMLPATLCPLSGEITVSMWHLVPVTLYGWRSGTYAGWNLFQGWNSFHLWNDFFLSSL